MTSNDSNPVLVGEEFLSLVSHEIRNPLTCITGYASFAEDAVRKNDHMAALESLQVVRSEARRIMTLAEDLLDMACVRAGKFTLQMSTLDLYALVNEIVMRHSTISGRQIELCTAARFCEIRGDPRRLAQVIDNLLANAVKYSPDASPIRVSLSENESMVRVAISNGGAVIPADKLPMLFKRFTRLRDGDGHGRRKGTGLGLYISKQIVEMHGGSITATSTATDGTEFTVELPRQSRENGGN